MRRRRRKRVGGRGGGCLGRWWKMGEGEGRETVDINWSLGVKKSNAEETNKN